MKMKCIHVFGLVLPLHLFLLASGQYHAHELASLSLCWDPGHVQVWDGPLPENVQVTCDLAEGWVRCKIFYKMGTVAFSLLFGKYCPIMV
jgi:hypothetical protein